MLAATTLDSIRWPGTRPPGESIEVKKLASAVKASGTGGRASDLVVVTGSENSIRQVIGEPQLKDDGGSFRDEAKAAGAHVPGWSRSADLTAHTNPVALAPDSRWPAVTALRSVGRPSLAEW